MDRIGGRKRQFYNNSWRFQYTNQYRLSNEIEDETGNKDLRSTRNHLDLMDTEKTLYPTIANTFFSNTCGRFSRIIYRLGHKIRHDRF